MTNDLDNLLKNTEVGALYLDRNLLIRKITPVVSKITNILQTDIGRPISHIAVMENYPDLISDIDLVVETLKSVDKEIEGKDGRVWQARIRPYRTDYNAVEGIMITFIDITKLKNVEKELRISDNIFNHSIDMLCIAGFDGYFKTLNPSWARTLGWSTQELLTKPWLEFVHPDDKQSTEKAKSTIVDGQEIYQFENRYICKDGSIKWLSWNSFPYPKENIMFGVARDVTLLKQTQKELDRSRELLQKTLDNSPLAKTLLDRDGNIIYTNKSAEKIFGITRKEVLDRSFDASTWKITGLDGKPIPVEELPFSKIKRTMKGITDYRHYIEVTGKSKVLLSISGLPVQTPDGQFDGAVFSIGVVE
jgi:PAS domain S-box-containing protein